MRTRTEGFTELVQMVIAEKLGMREQKIAPARVCAGAGKCLTTGGRR